MADIHKDMSEPQGQRGARSTRRAALRAGVAAGALGALLKIGWMMLAAVVHGRSALAPLRPLGATFRGEDAVLQGPTSFLYGLVLLVVVAALLGALFAALLPEDFEPGGAALLGVGYALFMMSIITSGVLPDVNPVLRSRMPALGGSWVIAISLYGLALGAVPWLRRRGARGDGGNAAT